MYLTGVGSNQPNLRFCSVSVWDPYRCRVGPWGARGVHTHDHTLVYQIQGSLEKEKPVEWREIVGTVVRHVAALLSEFSTVTVVDERRKGPTVRGPTPKTHTIIYRECRRDDPPVMRVKY